MVLKTIAMAQSDPLTPFKSPGGGTSQKKSKKTSQKNLTGHLRKLQDIAADVHNTLEKWESLNSKGNSFLSDIVNTKLEYLYQQDEGDAETEKEQLDVERLSQVLEPKCEALHQISESMEEMVSKLSSITATVQGIQSLCQHRGDDENILFTQWTIHQFVDRLATLHTMYAKELCLKKEICENVAHAETRQSLMFYSAAWVHQPFLNSESILSALLQETGHKSAVL